MLWVPTGTLFLDQRQRVINFLVLGPTCLIYDVSRSALP